MSGVIFAVVFDSLSIRLPSWDWKDSNFSTSWLFRIQFSHPKRSTGNTQVSHKSLAVRGLSLPWKRPVLPRAKNALLAFWIFSSTAMSLVRLLVSHVPNTLIEPLTGMLLSPTLTAFWELVLLGAVRARVVCRKLGFLQRAIKNESGLSSEVLRAIAADDIKTSLAVKQCSELEKPFQTSHTDHIITAGQMGEEVGDPSRDIMVKDWYVTISQAEKHPSITHLTTFARQSSWMKVWDYALDRGSAGTNRALAVLKLVSAPVYGDRRCMLPSCQSPIESTDTMINHFIKEHQEITPFPDADKLLSEICLSPDSLFNLGQSLLSAMHPDF